MTSSVKEQRSAVQAIQVRTDANGNSVASLDPGTSQLMKASSGEVAGSSILMPPGALSIPITLSIGQGASLVTDSLAKSVGLEDNAPKAVGPSVSFMPSETVVAISPFTLSIPISTSPSTTLSMLLGVAPEIENMIVIYHAITIVDGNKSYLTGIIPASDVVVLGKMVSFKTLYFGTFQVVSTPRKIERKIEKPIEEAPALKSTVSVSVIKILPTTARPGETVTIAGSGFTSEGTKYEVNIPNAQGVRQIAPISVVSSGKATFVMPSNSGLGARQIVVMNQGARISEHFFFANTASNPHPFMSVAPSEICSDQTYVNSSGDTVQGTKNCELLADCSSDGQTDCKATSAFKAVNMAVTTHGNIASGTTIAGVTGTLNINVTNCSSDAQTGCLTSSSYKAVDMSQVIANNISASTTIAGVTGNLVSPSSCSTPGQQNCLATSSYKAAQACSSEGESNCYIPSYDGTTNQLKAVSSADLTSASANYRAGFYIGTIQGSLSDCTAEGEQSCVTASGLSALNVTTFTAGDIKNGVSIAGVAGTYPSASTPMANDNSNLMDLNSSNFSAQMIVSDPPFEYWDSAGVRHQQNGDGNILTSNIKNGVTIFSETGSAPTYSVDPWDLRSEFNYNGLIGKLKFNCRNRVKLTSFDHSSNGLADWWDTIDDLLAPADNPAGWGPSNICTGVEVTQNDGQVWRDVTTTGDGTTASNCTLTSAHCSFQDRVTKLSWSKRAPSISMWILAVRYCFDLSHNGFSDWRLPEQKELIKAYIDGISSAAHMNWIADSDFNANFWTATSVSSSPDTDAYAINLKIGPGSSTTTKIVPNQVICVRP